MKEEEDESATEAYAEDVSHKQVLVINRHVFSDFFNILTVHVIIPIISTGFSCTNF